MNVLNLWVTLTLSLSFGASAYAHSDHVHKEKKPVSAEVAKANAQKSVAKFIELKKLDASWKKAELLSVEKKKFGSKFEWLVVFANKLEKDEAKKKLYVFLRLSGVFLAANHTGK